MTLSLSDLDGIPIISVGAPRIDAAGAIQFKEDFRGLAPAGAERVILDLDGVDFVDSSGLGAIVAVMKLLAPDTRLELSGLATMVQKVFSLTRMDEVFTIHERVSDAVHGAPNGPQ